MYGRMSKNVLYSFCVKIHPHSRHRTLTEARKAANKRYIDKFVEVKVRMTPEHRTEVQQHAQDMDESTTAFINRAIDETMARDKEAKKK